MRDQLQGFLVTGFPLCSSGLKSIHKLREASTSYGNTCTLAALSPEISDKPDTCTCNDVRDLLFLHPSPCPPPAPAHAPRAASRSHPDPSSQSRGPPLNPRLMLLQPLWALNSPNSPIDFVESTASCSQKRSPPCSPSQSRESGSPLLHKTRLHVLRLDADVVYPEHLTPQAMTHVPKNMPATCHLPSTENGNPATPPTHPTAAPLCQPRQTPKGLRAIDVPTGQALSRKPGPDLRKGNQPLLLGGLVFLRHAHVASRKQAACHFNISFDTVSGHLQMHKCAWGGP